APAAGASSTLPSPADHDPRSLRAPWISLSMHVIRLWKKSVKQELVMSMIRSNLLTTSLLIVAGCGSADLGGEPLGDVRAEHFLERASAGILCTTPPAAGPLIGWAAAAGGTQGGGSTAPVTVTTTAALQTAIGDDTPRVVYVQGKLSTTSQF